MAGIEEQRRNAHAAELVGRVRAAVLAELPEATSAMSGKVSVTTWGMDGVEGEFHRDGGISMDLRVYEGLRDAFAPEGGGTVSTVAQAEAVSILTHEVLHSLTEHPYPSDDKAWAAALRHDTAVLSEGATQALTERIAPRVVARLGLDPEKAQRLSGFLPKQRTYRGYSALIESMVSQTVGPEQTEAALVHLVRAAPGRRIGRMAELVVDSGPGGRLNPASRAALTDAMAERLHTELSTAYAGQLDRSYPQVATSAGKDLVGLLHNQMGQLRTMSLALGGVNGPLGRLLAGHQIEHTGPVLNRREWPQTRLRPPGGRE